MPAHASFDLHVDHGAHPTVDQDSHNNEVVRDENRFQKNGTAVQSI